MTHHQELFPKTTSDFLSPLSQNAHSSCTRLRQLRLTTDGFRVMYVMCFYDVTLLTV